MKRFAATALAALLAFPAVAQQSNCGPRDKVLERLASGFGETRQSIGLGSNSAVLEVFASIETGTWTITVTRPDGVTCVAAAGQSYENLSEPLPDQGDDT